ncbi:DarT ssDNA thymidine ADP-ribosyltransferase family protein, partial [Candidatus Margulisiibacteriota bacterium]
ICVIGIRQSILNQPNIIVTDMNASSDYVGFFEADEGIKRLDENLVYTQDWRDDDHFEMCRKRSAACAEVLIPDSLPASNIEKIYVSCQAVCDKIKADISSIGFEIPVIINPKMFFQEM